MNSILIYFLFLLSLLIGPSFSVTVTIRNDISRLDTEGNVVDCHSGNIVYLNGTFFLYGERYGNSSGFNETDWPQLHVYTSKGTYFTPFAVYNQQTHKFVVWFNAYLGGCCQGNFGIAQSDDGIRFTIVSLNEEPFFDQVDCNGLFVDDDGTGYVIYASLENDHRVSIEKLTPDFLHTTKENYGLFPDHYVEGSVLFKRNGFYYATFGSCCCFCRGGSGVVMYYSRSLRGPWKRMKHDLNCKTDSNPICGAYGERVSKEPLIINAQGIGLSLIPTISDGKLETTYLWHGERWLSAPNNNPACPDECRPQTGDCQEPSNYIKGDGYMYWIPLQFNDDGTVQPFQPFINSFQLNIP